MLLGDAVAITQLLRNYCLICQLYLTECVDDGDNPPTRLISSGDPCRIQERPLNSNQSNKILIKSSIKQFDTANNHIKDGPIKQ